MMVAVIGLEHDVIAQLKDRCGKDVRFTIYEAPPRIYAHQGKAYLAHSNIMDHYITPDFVIWYGYFEDPDDPKQSAKIRSSRLALAISNTPSYPDVRTTLPWDDKMLSVVMALNVEGISPARGLFPHSSGTAKRDIQRTPKTVLKWGNGHCGDGKQLLMTGDESVTASYGHDVLAEPFVEGRSYRILIVDNYLCQLEYESPDWRKNVQSTIKLSQGFDIEMASRAQEIADHCFLSVAGIDFVKPHDGFATLLEVNAYPSLEQDTKNHGITSKIAFCRQAAEKIQEAADALRSAPV